MNLQAYLDRIGFSGVPRVDAETLKAMQRLHLRTIPYENFDVQLGRPMTLDPQAAFDKLVNRRRGGWCYEMNGLLGAMLREVGFEVTEMAGAVLRGERGPSSHANHLVLRVDLDRPYIADVGFGDALLEAAPLEFGPHHCAGFDFAFEALDDGWLRFHNHPLGGAPYYDFRNEPADREELAAMCRSLSSAPDSVFTQTAFAFRHEPGGVAVLRGRTFNFIRPGEKTTQFIDSADVFANIVRDRFQLDIPEARDLWPAVCARHEELFGALAS